MEVERERGDDPEKGTLNEDRSKWSVGILFARPLHSCDSRQREGGSRDDTGGATQKLQSEYIG